jgi:diguanylate cyclase (GGDEF)-like protein/PAS domain S-box-containing protein
MMCGTHPDSADCKPQQELNMLVEQVFAQWLEGIVVVDSKGNIVMTNKAFTEITGYSEAEVLGQNPRILKSGRQSSEFYLAMWDAIRTNGHWANEIWNRRKDGSIYPEWLTISALRDGQGCTTHYVAIFSDMSDARAAENRIQWLSHFDALTGLPNRRLLQDRTERAISMVKRQSGLLTMMLVGLDHFRTVNDAFGHYIGDALLTEVGKRIRAGVRDQDTVARLEGKKFILLLPNTPASGAAHLASELLRKLAQPYRLEGHDLSMTASIGIASCPENGMDFDMLLKSVEMAMQRAQTSGRDMYQFCSDDMYHEVLASERMTKALREAVQLDQLQLLYQPFVDLQHGRIIGLEALLRWQHPELGAISPAQFIPLAEKSGLINDFGEWVLRRACRDIRNWLNSEIEVPQVAVNVSPIQFRENNFIAQIKSAIAEWQVDPALICIEVTEGALMDNVVRSSTVLKELRELGLKLSLDDFGTGYSSLSYLKRFPFDKVKIDQSFVSDITSDRNDAVIVNVIISMAHGLGLKVIAEGVETEAQCEILRTGACDEIQGYFFSKPVDAESIAELLKEGRQLPPHLLRLQKPQRTLLLVDDEPNIVSTLKRLFRNDGHLILTASSGPEGLEVLARHKVDVIISDQRMPGMTGVEFLRAAKVNYPNTIRIVLSGYTELQAVTDAINEGAIYRFLTKPWEDDQLREHIHRAFEYKELLDENQNLDLKIRATNRELVAANRQLGDVLQRKSVQMERDETSLAITREALRNIALPLLGVDDAGLIAFANPAAEALFRAEIALMGAELAYALPAVDAVVAGAVEGCHNALQINDISYQVKWSAMGVNSRSRGKLITFTVAALKP